MDTDQIPAPDSMIEMETDEMFTIEHPNFRAVIQVNQPSLVNQLGVGQLIDSFIWTEEVKPKRRPGRPN